MSIPVPDGYRVVTKTDRLRNTDLANFAHGAQTAPHGWTDRGQIARGAVGMIRPTTLQTLLNALIDIRNRGGLNDLASVRVEVLRNLVEDARAAMRELLA